MTSTARRRALALVAAPAMVGALLVAATAPAAAADRTCEGDIGPEAVDGDVVVPDGATCGLDDVTVSGSIRVGDGATVVVRGGQVDLDVVTSASGAASVSTEGVTVVGDVVVTGGGSASITSTTIGGDLRFQSNDGPVTAEGNQVAGALVAEQNTGGVALVDNQVGGDLTCSANDPVPTGGGNSVAGTAGGQCADLDEGGPDPDPGPGGFRDVEPSSVHADAIDWLVERGITAGCNPDGDRFCPGDPVTRAQMATFLDRALELPAGSASFT
jgi:hypothetical protein